MAPPGTSSDKGVQFVPVEETGYYIPQLRFMLQHDAYLVEPMYRVEDILGFIADSTYQLWIGGDPARPDMFALTEVSQTPRVKIVSVVWCSGQNMQPYLARFLLSIEAYAEIVEADLIQVTGRWAWKRLLEEFGFEFFQLIMRKRVDDGPEDSEQNDAGNAAGLI